MSEELGAPQLEALMAEGVVQRADACSMLGCGHTSLDGLIAEGKIPAFKRGKTLVIPRTAIRRYLATLPPAEINYARKPRDRAAEAARRDEAKPAARRKRAR